MQLVVERGERTALARLERDEPYRERSRRNQRQRQYRHEAAAETETGHGPPEIMPLARPHSRGRARRRNYDRVAIAAAAPAMKVAAVRLSDLSARGVARNQRASAASARQGIRPTSSTMAVMAMSTP